MGRFEAGDLQIIFQTTLTGVAKKFYLAWTQTQRGREWLASIANDKSPTTFAAPIYEQFCGDTASDGERVRQTAKTNLFALKICKMKYFEEYVNEFQEYYCTTGETDNEDLIYLLYRKLPEPWRTAVEESIEQKPLSGYQSEDVLNESEKYCVSNVKPT